MTDTPRRKIRCAIYTRKSTEEGLEMEFNSLDAQRESGEAYIASQKQEGWIAVNDHYDDGGFTGANTDRPALKRLLRDVQAGMVDIVVVYKVDRLSRSLADFARMVEVFDQHNVAFVSVTQQFNSTTPMGRLTLNILFSFAQFEREVIGERIRDKIAASKKKGMWMGGVPPLGYECADRKLVINESDAAQVRHIFNRFIELGSITELVIELQEQGYHTKSYTSKAGRLSRGNIMDKGYLYKMLQNRAYIGEIVHKDKCYPGLHSAIIDQETWDKAHAVFKESPFMRAGKNRTKTPALLQGIVFCGSCGFAMVPVHTRKASGKLYRYYKANLKLRNICESCKSGSVAAGELEDIVIRHIKGVFATPEILIRTWKQVRSTSSDFTETEVNIALTQFHVLWNELFPTEQARILRLLIERVTIKSHNIDVKLRTDGLGSLVRELQAG